MGQFGKILRVTIAMRWNWVLGGVALVTLLLLAYAWMDGGREPLRAIVQPIPIPGAAK